MSLDVYLIVDKPVKQIHSGVFTRQDGQTVEVLGTDYDCVTETTTVFDWNITHNLGKMAKEAGLYEVLWRPEELGFTKAGELIKPMTDGMIALWNNPEAFKLFNPDNGWGCYENLLEFVQKYLIACVEYPDATIEISR
jgi:hypothetical protein